jgi:hypothetical protein
MWGANLVMVMILVALHLFWMMISQTEVSVDALMAMVCVIDLMIEQALLIHRYVCN